MVQPAFERQKRHRDKKRLERLEVIEQLKNANINVDDLPPITLPASVDKPFTNAQSQRRYIWKKKLELEQMLDKLREVTQKVPQFKKEEKVKRVTKKITTVKSKKAKPKKVKPKKGRPAKKIKKTKTVQKSLQTFEKSFVMVKDEPVEKLNLVVESSHCRCCFKLMNNLEVQFVATEAIFQIFQDAIQITLENSAIATNFCEKCFNDINNFSHFKNLSIAKQQKFLELSSNGGDINMIYQMKVSQQDPLIKDEDMEQKSVVKEETFNWNQEFDDNNDSYSYSENEVPFDEISPDLDSPAEEPEKIPFSTRAKCLQCGTKPRNMKKHLVDYHPIRCYKCKFKAADSDEMMKHIEKQHDLEEQHEPQACPICGKMIRTKMKKHIEAVHQKIKKYFCDICGFAAYQRQYIINHMKTSHLRGEIKCDECSFVAVTNWRLKLHKRNRYMEKDPRIKCDHCSRIFCSKTYLQVHIARKHQNKKEAFCSICKREFFSKKDLERHFANIHNKRDTVICDVCGKPYAGELLLKKHKLLHRAVESQFHCELCKINGVTRYFPIKTRLKYHIERSHMRKKNFHCDKCPRSFYRIDELNVHKLQHDGIRFHCSVPGCKSAVTRKSVLIFHLQHNHSLSPEEMKECMDKLNEYCSLIKCNR